MVKWNRLVLAAALALPLVATGCGHSHVYVWGAAEGPYYTRWEAETHRDHVEWEARSEADHNAYWKWRRHHQ